MELLVWITQTETGDIQELNLKGGQKMYLEQKQKLMYLFAMISITIIS